MWRPGYEVARSFPSPAICPTSIPQGSEQAIHSAIKASSFTPAAAGPRAYDGMQWEPYPVHPF